MKWWKKLLCRLHGHDWRYWQVKRGYLRMHGKPWRWRECRRCGARQGGWY